MSNSISFNFAKVDFSPRKDAPLDTGAEVEVDGIACDRHRSQGFMDYTDDDCAPASLRTPSPLIAYNGHAGLGVNLASDCMPEVDDEVLVAFEHGEPRRPCLIASLWNSGDKPPEMSR